MYVCSYRRAFWFLFQRLSQRGWQPLATKLVSMQRYKTDWRMLHRLESIAAGRVGRVAFKHMYIHGSPAPDRDQWSER